jgi:hypothetical protein
MVGTRDEKKRAISRIPKKIKSTAGLFVQRL